MHSCWRTLTLGVVLALGVVLGADIENLSAQASDPRMGTWKLNLAKFPVQSRPGPTSLDGESRTLGPGGDSDR